MEQTAVPHRASDGARSSDFSNPDTPEVNALRAEIEHLRQREAQVMSLIGCKQPEKLMHDLRNLLNEVQLLRVLADVDKQE